MQAPTQQHFTDAKKRLLTPVTIEGCIKEPERKDNLWWGFLARCNSTALEGLNETGALRLVMTERTLPMEIAIYKELWAIGAIHRRTGQGCSGRCPGGPPGGPQRPLPQVG